MFKRTRVGLEYIGGHCKTLIVDPDKISWFDLEDIVENSLGIKFIYYLLPNCMTFGEGLRKITDDKCVMEMAKIGTKYRAMDLYIVKVGEETDVIKELYKSAFGDEVKKFDDDTSSRCSTTH